MVDHTLMIEKFIHLGVRGAIVPWLYDFINERVQCVRYNQALSDYKVLKGGLPQGTKVGLLGFQGIINDAASDIAPQKCWKYVDDLTLAENRTHSASSKLQEVLDVFFEVDHGQQSELESHQVSGPPRMFQDGCPTTNCLEN